MKNLGARRRGIIDAEYDTGRRVFEAGGTDGASHALVSPNGNRYSLYLYWNGKRWNWNYNWLDNNRNANNPSAVSVTLFITPNPLQAGSGFS